MTRILSLLRNERGASAAEFALVLPVLLIFLFGIIDAGRLAWEMNQIAKATQMGARFAVVTDVLDSGLRDHSYLGYDPVGTPPALTQGDRIPKEALGQLLCTSTGCTCAVSPCPAAGTFNSGTFNLLVARMRDMRPDITAANVQVAYSGSGLGFAGDPNGMDIAPTVSVSVVGMNFVPLTTLAMVSVPLPDSRTSLTAEDGSGTTSN
jgi:Flp pilus assembly pilin Flp